MSVIIVLHTCPTFLLLLHSFLKSILASYETPINYPQNPTTHYGATRAGKQSSHGKIGGVIAGSGIFEVFYLDVVNPYKET